MWQNAQLFEKNWWGKCINTYGEEQKQFLYASKMGLKIFHDGKSPYNFDLQWKSIIDIGGGPVSLLLKCVNLYSGLVIDPCNYPTWIKTRYELANIQFINGKGEDTGFFSQPFDEAWIYNVLQHCENPEKVIKNAQQSAKLIRLFEWIDYEVSEGHIHKLTEKDLNKWLGGQGKVEILQGQSNCWGKCYYGIFPT
jgi:hypothetical protein